MLVTVSSREVRCEAFFAVALFIYYSMYCSSSKNSEVGKNKEEKPKIRRVEDMLERVKKFSLKGIPVDDMFQTTRCNLKLATHMVAD